MSFRQSRLFSSARSSQSGIYQVSPLDAVAGHQFAHHCLSFQFAGGTNMILGWSLSTIQPFASASCSYFLNTSVQEDMYLFMQHIWTCQIYSLFKFERKSKLSEPSSPKRKSI